MILIGKRQQNINIQQQPHGNSSSNSFTISLETVSEPIARFATLNPLIGSTTYSFTRFGMPCGVSTMLSPLTSQTRRTPGAKPSLLRTSRGSTTCPLLESRVVITGIGCHHGRLASSKNVLLSWVTLEWRYWNYFGDHRCEKERARWSSGGSCWGRSVRPTWGWGTAERLRVGGEKSAVKPERKVVCVAGASCNLDAVCPWICCGDGQVCGQECFEMYCPLGSRSSAHLRSQASKLCSRQVHSRLSWSEIQTRPSRSKPIGLPQPSSEKMTQPSVPGKVGVLNCWVFVTTCQSLPAICHSRSPAMA